MVLSASLCVAVPYLAAARQLPTISATAANGANVVVVGKNLGGTTEVTVGEAALTSLAVNPDGTTVTGTLPSVPGARFVRADAARGRVARRSAEHLRDAAADAGLGLCR